MKKENLAIIEMLVCATLWSIAGIFIKLIPWNGFAVAGMRSLIAGATIALYMLIARHRFVLSKKTFLAGALSACVYTCFVCANKLTTAANAIVLQFTSPVFIVIFAFGLYAFFSGGPGILQWLYPNELFPTEVRATAVGISISISRIGTIAGTFGTPIILSNFGVGPTMLIAAGLVILGLVLSIIMAPETKDMTLEETSRL